MAKKVLLQDWNKNEILPITRGELILDSSGKKAFHSNEFLATTSQPGLMSAEDKNKLDNFADSIVTYDLVSATTDGLAPKIGTEAAATIATHADEWVLTSTKGAIPTWRKLPINAFENDTYALSGALNNNDYTVTLTSASGTTTATIPSMVAATSDTDGKAGLVPTPSANSQDKYLKGDGTWSDVDATKLGGINPIGFMRVKASYVNKTSISANDMTDSGSYRLESENEGLPLEPNYGNVLVVRGLTGVSYGDTLAQMFFPYFTNAVYLRTGSTGTGTYGFTNREWSRFVLGDDKIKTTNDTDGGVKVELSGTFDEPKIDVTTTFGKVSLSNTSNTVTGETIAKSVPLLIGTNGTVIPKGADLNTLEYCEEAGTYVSRSLNNTQSLANCPATSTFTMTVSIMGYETSLTGKYAYRVRKITDLRGNEWIQRLYTDSVAGEITFDEWKRIIRNDTYFTKASTATVDGTSVVQAGTGGAVPPPQTLEDNSKFLKGDGTWAIPSTKTLLNAIRHRVLQQA